MTGSPAPVRRHVAFLTQDDLLPLHNGARIRNARLLEAMARTHDVTVVFTEAPSRATAAWLCDRAIAHVHVPKPRLFRLGALASLARGVPLRFARPRNAALDRWLLERADTIDVAVAATVGRCPGPRVMRRIPTVVDTHNIEYMRHARERAGMTQVRRWGDRLLNGSRVRRHELDRLRRGACVVCAPYEAEMLHADGVAAAVVPNGASVPSVLPPRTEGPVPVYAYIGDLGYGPNRQAVDALLGDVIPAVPPRPGTPRRWIVAVRGADDALRRRAAGAGAEVASPVDDMAAVVAAASAVVLPITSGGGTRLKVLEAMAAGVPVIGTATAVEGIDLVDGENALIGDRPEDLPGRILRLEADPALAQTLRERAFALVAARYAWPMLGERFVGVVERHAATRSRRPPQTRLAAGWGPRAVRHPVLPDELALPPRPPFATGALDVAIVTLGRVHELRRLLESIGRQTLRPAAVRVVCNGPGSASAAETVEAEFPHVEVIRLGENYGAVARNAAMSRATAEYLVTLDDDVWLDDSATLRRVVDAFRAAPDAGAITFRVREAETGRELNGCVHPSRAAGGEPIETATFAGGAVAFRTGVLADVGLYPPDYFISIEEDDLAVRMMDVGRRVVYRPDISVTHSFSERGRASWRRHYFDLRNSVWFAARHYPVRDAVRFSARRTLRLGWLAMRDGYPLWPLKALHDAVAGLPSIARTRRVLGPDALARIRTLKGGRL